MHMLRKEGNRKVPKAIDAAYGQLARIAPESFVGRKGMKKIRGEIGGRTGKTKRENSGGDKGY